MCTILDDAQPLFAPLYILASPFSDSFFFLSLSLSFLFFALSVRFSPPCVSRFNHLNNSRGVDRGCATKPPFHHEAIYKQVTICWGAHGGSKACISASLPGWTRSALHLRQLASVERNHHDRGSRLSDWILGPVHVSAGVGRVLFGGG